jgi:quercetin dioxygenase-like cupin family protein
MPFSKRKHPMTSTTTQPAAAIPPDDSNRKLTVADPDDPKLRHVSVAGGTYTILVSGEQTGGRYCLIDMLVPAGGGPPPHRHDFEEMFTILDGDIELTFRGEVQRASTGSTVNVPANAPHSFKNLSDKPARLLCLCTPAGQEEFFMAVGDPRRRPHRATAEAQHRRAGRTHPTRQGAFGQISHRAVGVKVLVPGAIGHRSSGKPCGKAQV